VIFFLLGLAALAVMMGALGMFSRAKLSSIKQFGGWTLALAGLSLAALLFLTGKGALAISALFLLGPMVWQWMGKEVPRRPGGTARPPSQATMARSEALQILGLKSGASEAEVKAAHHRLMRAAHPDAGGSDWLAARINQARDVLLGP